VNKVDLARFDLLHRIGCICCRKAGSGYRAPDVHHILVGGRRAGHQFTLPLCPEHHRIPSNGSVVGPSLADGSKLFASSWGAQTQLLTEVNELIRELQLSINRTAPPLLRNDKRRGEPVPGAIPVPAI
jgi:hypothetical protein